MVKNFSFSQTKNFSYVSWLLGFEISSPGLEVSNLHSCMLPGDAHSSITFPLSTSQIMETHLWTKPNVHNRLLLYSLQWLETWTYSLYPCMARTPAQQLHWKELYWNVSGWLIEPCYRNEIYVLAVFGVREGFVPKIGFEYSVSIIFE